MKLIDTERGNPLDNAIAITTSKTSRAANTQIFWARDYGSIHSAYAHARATLSARKKLFALTVDGYARPVSQA